MKNTYTWLFQLLLGLTLLTGCDALQQVSAPLTGTDVGNGLKEALQLGVNLAGRNLNSNVFGPNFLVNELLPADVGKALNTARQLGFGAQVDQINSKVSQAAVSAVQQSLPIFRQAITQMSFKDAWAILRGGNGAGTRYLRETVGATVLGAIQPQVNSLFQSVGLKPTVLQSLGVNNPLLKSLDYDMSQALTRVINTKIFNEIERQENDIRTNIGSRATLLLQRVFAAQ